MYNIKYMSKIPLTRLGRAIRSMRHARGLTQAAVAELARLPRLKVIQVERGDPRVSVDAYAGIARAVGGELGLVPFSRPTLEEARELFTDVE